MKHIYFFGNKLAEGDAKKIDLLGGKGANLAEMSKLKIPVPPGLTISTDVCNYFIKNNSYPSKFKTQFNNSFKKIEKTINQKFNDPNNPLLVSVRSGAKQSMPGMMETVLNIGLTSKTIPGLIKKFGNEKFVYDSYRRLIMMYADVVMEKSQNLNFVSEKGIRSKLEEILEKAKEKRNLINDADLNLNELKKLSKDFKKEIKNSFGEEFPDDANTQLWNSIAAVFNSWNGKRAIHYRKIENIPDNWGTAVNIQSMVFGNLNSDSATGVVFSRNPSSGNNIFYGEWLQNAQGEDVVAGTRTPNPINFESTTDSNNTLITLENSMPKIYLELVEIKNKLESHYLDMQDIEFTVQNNKLWILQTRNAKRSGFASIKIALDMINEKLISEKQALKRIQPKDLIEILHPTVDPNKEKNAQLFTKGLPAGPGGAVGKIVFTPDDAIDWKKNGENIILVRNETSPEDVHGMFASDGIITSKGGMTSHAALVARGWGKCCVVGCSDLIINYDKKTVSIKDKILKEGDVLTVNGNSGNIYLDKIPLISGNIHLNKYFNTLMKLCDKYKKLEIRTNAESPEDAKIAKNFGANGIGLCRTEHMFFHPDRIQSMQEMILSQNKKERILALNKLLPYQKNDFYHILKKMSPNPVTIRLLDPPLHEFLPNSKEQIALLSSNLNVPKQLITDRIETLHELNPMLGHRGCRLGILYPEITKMQIEAVSMAAIELHNKNIACLPEIMIPLVGSLNEFINQKTIVVNTIKKIQKENNVTFNYLIGTMIELPRACLIADKIAMEADFFSFGTNDLTQTVYGFSRDDINTFLNYYLENDIIKKDPFQSIDQQGVGELIKIAVSKAKKINSNIKLGICGEHGGDPNSIKFFNKIKLNYISCSPFRVPIARLSAAKANIN